MGRRVHVRPDVRQLFLDLDGVLSDIYGFYEHLFSIHLERDTDPANFWEKVEAYGERRFFREMPMLPDAKALWDGGTKLHPAPIILTGLPKRFPHVEQQKRAWVAEHISPTAQVITCLSENKRDHGKPGDILVDDWSKWRSRWTDMGGFFILHTSAKQSLLEIEEVWGVHNPQTPHHS